jgi:predicted nuclease of predicted toxin-antitoxin system
MSSAGGPSEARPIRYYFDEHVRLAVARYLREHGIDVLTAYEAGRANQQIPDSEQLAYALAVERILVSSDVHFLNPRLIPQLATGQHAGIVRLRTNPHISIGDHARYLRYIAENETMETIAGQLRYFERIPHGMFPDD